MIKLTPLQAFHVFYKYVFENWDVTNDTWALRDFLSEADIDPKVACHSGGPTADPAVWYDWKDTSMEVLNDKNLRSEINESVYLTQEQALIAMCYFLELRYWSKDHDISLRRVMEDVNFYLKSEHFSKTIMWNEWLQSVSKGLQFNEKFNENYQKNLEHIRQEFWGKRGYRKL